ncbi:MAG: winged helix-turn-helix transcriptional regulator [Candidatus Margulisbacteria bacterium]|nr:winged helix-turn-helix transcriptional regulator [Candidatus Margulisiibacteriota bacterium]
MELLHKKFLIDIIIALKDEPLAFNEIQSRLKIYSDTLSRRLKELEELGIIEAVITTDDKGKRVRYRLTVKGNKIAPMLIEAVKILKTVDKFL